MSSIGKLIREGRLRKKISQMKFIIILGLQSDAQLSRWESGAELVPFKHLDRIALVLEINYRTLERAWLTDLNRKTKREAAL